MVVAANRVSLDPLWVPSGAQQSKIHIPSRPRFAPHIEWGGEEGWVKKV